MGNSWRVWKTSDKIGYQKVSLRWVPHLLMENQRSNRVTVCAILLLLLNRGRRYLKSHCNLRWDISALYSAIKHALSDDNWTRFSAWGSSFTVLLWSKKKKKSINQHSHFHPITQICHHIDYDIFRSLKEELDGRRFDDDQSMETFMHNWLWSTFLMTKLKKLLIRWEKSTK